MKHEYLVEGSFSFKQKATSPSVLTLAVRKAIVKEGLLEKDFDISVSRVQKEEPAPKLEVKQEEPRQERREKKLKKRKGRMPQHGKGLAKVYKDAINKRKGNNK